MTPVSCQAVKSLARELTGRPILTHFRAGDFFRKNQRGDSPFDPSLTSFAEHAGNALNCSR